MSHLRSLLAAGLLFGITAGAASADVTYTYTGSNFNLVYGPPYTTGDRITGSVTLTAPLANQRPLSDATNLLKSLEFDDGHQTRSWTQGQPFPDTFVCDIRLGTDANGKINSWAILLRDYTFTEGSPQYSLEFYNPALNTIYDQVGEGPAKNVVCGSIALSTGASRRNAADVTPWEALPEGLIFRNGFEATP
jgi:hypothetical protein